MRFHTVLTFQVAQELTSQKFVSFPGDAKGFTVPVSPHCIAWHRGTVAPWQAQRLQPRRFSAVETWCDCSSIRRCSAWDGWITRCSGGDLWRFHVLPLPTLATYPEYHGNTMECHNACSKSTNLFCKKCAKLRR